MKTRNDVRIGEYSTIHEDCQLGKNIEIGMACNILGGTEIGDETRLGYGVRIEEVVKVGKNCRFGHVSKIESGSNIGDAVNVGVCSAIGRESIIAANTDIGDRSKFDRLRTAENVIIGSDVNAKGLSVKIEKKGLVIPDFTLIRRNGKNGYVELLNVDAPLKVREEGIWTIIEPMTDEEVARRQASKAQLPKTTATIDDPVSLLNEVFQKQYGKGVHVWVTLTNGSSVYVQLKSPNGKYTEDFGRNKKEAARNAALRFLEIYYKR